MEIRRFLLILLSAFAMLAHGQSHMKILGIPIDGKIDTFAAKLVEAGLKRDVSSDALSVKNAYIFNGTFFGQEAEFQAHYTHDTREVYEVSVFFVRKSYIDVFPIQRDILKAIEEKYTFKKETKDKTIDSYDYYIFEGLDPVGLISTFIVDSRTIPNTKSAMLSITYSDVENLLKYEDRKRKDI